jgi:hypothetical protein
MYRLADEKTIIRLLFMSSGGSLNDSTGGSGLAAVGTATAIQKDRDLPQYGSRSPTLGIGKHTGLLFTVEKNSPPAPILATSFLQFSQVLDAQISVNIAKNAGKIGRKIVLPTCPATGTYKHS